MENSKVRSYLEGAASVAVLLAATAVLASLAAMYFRPGAGPRLQAGIQKGEVLAGLPGFNFGESERSLLIAMSTGCVSCDESTPFYQQLRRGDEGSGQGVRLVALLPESEVEVRQYLREKQIEIAAVPTVNLKALKVAGTPTVILVDSAGRVLDFWVGKLPQETERQVMKVISN